MPQQKRLEHFIGYTVQEISKLDDGQPALVLDDGWKIGFGKRTKLDKGLVGQRIANIEESGENGVRILFNQDETPTRKGDVMIFNPDTGELVDPYEVIDPNADLPPDPSSERITDGPTDEEVRRELDARTDEEAGETE